MRRRPAALPCNAPASHPARTACGVQADLKTACSRDAAINSQVQQEAAKLLASLPV